MSWKIAYEDERYYANAESMPGAQKAHRLAAAAPDLLEALEWYAEQVEDLNRNSWTAEKALGVLRADRGKKALAAIAKAKGE